MRSAVVRVGRKDKVLVRATSRRLWRVCIFECMKLYGERGTRKKRRRNEWMKCRVEI